MDEKQGVSVESESYTVRMDFEFIDYVQPHTAETGEEISIYYSIYNTMCLLL